MLKAENLTCGYGGEPVIKNLSFSVKPNEKLCVIGPNGCGKTTLLRALSGVLASSGSITDNGIEIASLPRREIAKRIALMGQISSIYFPYTVYETVMLGRFPHQRSGLLSGESSEDKEIVRECLERTDIFNIKDRMINELSGGQLQRVFLARTFAQAPRIILLDEPTNHLDLKYQLELVDYLKEWASDGDRCVVGVLHDINLALTFADTILLMSNVIS